MKLKAYDDYEPTNDGWIGRIPNHWHPAPLRWYLQIRSGEYLSNDEFSREADDDLPVPVVGGNGVTGYGTRSNLADTSIVIGRVGAHCGNIHEVPSPAWVTDNALILSQLKGFQHRYLYHVLRSMNLNRFANENAQPLITGTLVKEQQAPLPPPEEQEQIARFLDVSVGKIDTLVSKKRELIELLQEKRRALVSRCVTRGLPPDAARAAGLDPQPKLKPSGVDWLGDVPEHWETPPLYARYSQELGKMLDAKQITGEHLVPYLRNVDVQWDNINTEELREMDIRPQEYPRFLLGEGDLVVCEGGEVGRAAIWNGELEMCAYQKALHRLRVNRQKHGDIPRFLYYVFRFAADMDVFIAQGNPNTIPHLTGEKLRVYRFPFPPSEEQKAIVKFLDKESALLESAVQKVHEAIEQLLEYRSALITAAVTGKIDVREVEV